MTWAGTAVGVSAVGTGAQMYGASQSGKGGEMIETEAERQKREAAAAAEERFTGGVPTVWTYIQPQKNPLAALAAYNLTQKGELGKRQGGLFLNTKGIGENIKARQAARKEGGTPILDNMAARLRGEEVTRNPILNPETVDDRRAYLAMAPQVLLPKKIYTPAQIEQQLLNKAAPANQTGNPLASAMITGWI